MTSWRVGVSLYTHVAGICQYHPWQRRMHRQRQKRPKKRKTEDRGVATYAERSTKRPNRRFDQLPNEDHLLLIHQIRRLTLRYVRQSKSIFSTRRNNTEASYPRLKAVNVGLYCSDSGHRAFTKRGTIHTCWTRSGEVDVKRLTEVDLSWAPKKCVGRSVQNCKVSKRLSSVCSRAGNPVSPEGTYFVARDTTQPHTLRAIKTAREKIG